MKMRTAHNLFELKEAEKITTNIQLIDKYLRGGIALGRITELVGPPGAGKTQMCLKLCLNVQIPKASGGLEGGALYMDTRKDFDPTRLKELASDLEERLKHNVPHFKAIDMLKNVFYVDCPNAAQLMANVLNLSNYLAALPNIKLIVVDSLSFVIRMLESVTERTALLMELHDCMHQIISNHNLAFVVTNELGYRRHKRRWQLQPILGQKHTHLINERIWLTENGYFIGKALNTRQLIANL